jgi:hypothetical protein
MQDNYAENDAGHVGPGAAAVMQTIIDYNQKNPLATFKSHH